MMEEIEVSDCTKQRFDELVEELYGGSLDEDTALFLLCEEILDD